MSKMKKLASLLLALAMCLSLSVTAFAASTITINNDTDKYTYVAYQIFSGTYDSTSGDLIGLDWGSAFDDDTYGTIKSAMLSAYNVSNVAELAAGLAADSTDSNYIDAEEFAAYLADLTLKSAGTFNYDSTNTNYTLSGLTDGYYLVVNTAVPSSGTDTAYSNYILRVVGENVTVSPKSDVPQLDKKVSDVDASIGDTVTYTLTASLPSKYADYDTYKLIFHDTLSSGLTYNNNVTVTVYDSEAGYTGKTDTGTAVASGYSASYDDTNKSTTGTTITVTITDTNKLYDSNGDAIDVTANSIIVVTFTAKLNENAVIGGDGNPNTVYLEYSNNPNWDGNGTEETGNTPNDTVITWTYELDVTKVDGTDNTTTLSGAEFKLYRYQSDGTTKEYVQVDSTSNKVTGWTTTEADGSTLTSNSSGLFSVTGLDVGTYYLTETKAPTGYNLLDSDIELVIAATYNSESGTWISDDAYKIATLTVTVGSTTTDGDTSKGTVDVTVENNSGSSLPSTGGMGTTMIYVIGTIVALALAILLITKKRMERE
ncbi:MAG: SpaH/EbpB family LPXTG-anchored major pilin [Lachnospiraceae bacterium]|nr:SpaH/EbpB family LPXTG-anchored major pilin [Lachnospiraceae bacterium]